jgi:glycosyltransferase involved in cell wall biosynthesis
MQIINKEKTGSASLSEEPHGDRILKIRTPLTGNDEHVTEREPISVLHVALNPVTGVWSVMKELALSQSRSGMYASVGVGVLSDNRWPQLCREELATLPMPSYSARTLACFGTAQFLWQRIQHPPITQWAVDLMKRTRSSQCVVHFHNAWLSGVFLPLDSAEGVTIRSVATFHGVNAHFHRQPVRQCLHRWMAARLGVHGATLTSVDRGNLARAQSLLAMNPNDFSVVPNGITDTDQRGCPSLSGRTYLTLGHVGSMMPQKGWRLLVDAARILREMGHDVRVILAGRGADAELAVELARKSGGGLTYEGFVANPRETVLSKLDALILMSDQEGLPMAIIEALSLGVPVIATRVGGVPEAVVHGENGLLIERSVEALVEAIKQLVTNREKLQSMSRKAREMFKDRFEISHVVSAYDKVYRMKQ